MQKPQKIRFIVMSLFFCITPGRLMADECHLTPVIHVLQHPGCVPKPIPSFACTGICTSYVQVRIFITKTYNNLVFCVFY